jgi:hypothetical protein
MPASHVPQSVLLLLVLLLLLFLLLLQAVLETPDAQAANTAGLQLAAALAFAVYGFREYKKLSLGESLSHCYNYMLMTIVAARDMEQQFGRLVCNNSTLLWARHGSRPALSLPTLLLLFRVAMQAVQLGCRSVRWLLASFWALR